MAKKFIFSEIISYELDEDGEVIEREKELKRIPLSHCAFEGALGWDDKTELKFVDYMSVVNLYLTINKI